MKVIVDFTVEDVKPKRSTLLEQQGGSPGEAVPARLDKLFDDALRLLGELAEPTGLLEEIERDDFAAVFLGHRRNESRTPVGDIFPIADRLALFAVTLGDRIAREISERFAASDLALASLLDAAASMATDNAAELVERRYGCQVAAEGEAERDTYAMRYSPGYCGWHISGQAKLFEVLCPGRIGISLSESFLMEPLKSVSGVILVGRRKIHEFEMNYSFCADCEPRGCRGRIQALTSV